MTVADKNPTRKGDVAMSAQQEGVVFIDRNGKTYTATFRVENGMIEVSTGYERKTAQLGSSPPEVLARFMLGEMINESKG
jgi:hypothetical protein